jgi:hypothetical protein
MLKRALPQKEKSSFKDQFIHVINNDLKEIAKDFKN